MDKICFVSLGARSTFIHDGPASPGGAEMQVNHLAARLARFGDYEIHVIVSDQGQSDVEKVNQVLLHRLPQPPRGTTHFARLRRTAASAVSLHKLIKYLDCRTIFTRGFGPEPGIVTRTAGHMQSRHIHMTATDREFQPPWIQGGGLTHWLYRHGLRHASDVVYQNQAQEQQSPSWHTRNRHVIHSMYPFPEFTPSTDGHVLWVGRCRTVKQPECLVSLAARLPDIPFTMITSASDHEPKLMERLEDAARPLENLELIRGLPHNELIYHYTRASILVNTSVVEGMPNTFLEAAARACCLVSLHVNPDSIFDDSRAGICACGSLDQLASIIHNLHESPNRQQDLASRAYQFLRKRHEIENIIPRFRELLKQPDRARIHEKGIRI